MTLRDAAEADQPVILALNEADVTATSPLGLERLRSLLRVAFRARVAGNPGEPDGFLLAFDERASYESPNFLWFREHYSRFVYIDRVIVAPRARRSGLGRAFYLDLISAARQAGHTVMACEVNVDPPNPGSDAFHASLEFSEVGRAVLKESGKTVRYLARIIG